jgi:hypothetical protein
MNRLFTDGRWNAAHWIFVAFFVVLSFFMIGIGFTDPMATTGMFAIFSLLGLAWLALLSIAVVTLLRRTRDIHASIKRFEEMTEASLHLEKTTPPPLRPRGEFSSEQAGEPRLRTRL